MTKTKKEFLKESATLNPHPEKIKAERFVKNEFFDPNDLLQVRYELVRGHKKEKLAISEIANIFGVTRLTVYRLIEAFEKKGLQGLLSGQRGPKKASKMTDTILDFIENMIKHDKKTTKDTMIERIKEEFGIKVHRRTLERALKKSLKQKKQY